MNSIRAFTGNQWRRYSAGLVCARWSSLRTSRVTFCIHVVEQSRCRKPEQERVVVVGLLRTNDVTRCFVTSSVTTPRSCRGLLRWKNTHLQFYWCVTSWIILSQISHQNRAWHEQQSSDSRLFHSQNIIVITRCLDVVMLITVV